MGPFQTPGRRKQRSSPAFYIIIGICIGISALKSRVGVAQTLQHGDKERAETERESNAERGTEPTIEKGSETTIEEITEGATEETTEDLGLVGRNESKPLDETFYNETESEIFWVNSFKRKFWNCFSEL